MTELSRYFPQGMKVVYPYDTTPFTKVAIEEVVKTLFEAIVLVFLVMYLFMGNMRATLIPTIAVPVVLLGTFAVLGLFGFSINMLTMFAMVLAIGLFSGRRHCRCGERGTDHVRRRAFAPGSHRQVHGTNYTRVDRHRIGALGCLCSHGVFGGSTGVIYRQFSVTVIASMLLSLLVALILTPVLCASLLKPVPKGHEPAESGISFLRPFFDGLTASFPISGSST